MLQTLVTRELLAQAAEDFDLYYSDLLLDKEIVAQEVFQIDGVFNADQFQRVIGGAGYSPLSYRAEMRTDKLFEQMLSGITRSVFLTDDEAARYAALLAQSRDFAYLHIKVTDLLDEVEVTDEDIESYYNQNREDFVTEETVRLAYVEVNRDDLAAALEVDEAALETYFQQNIGLYSTDESHRLAHILIEVDTTEDAAKAEAEAIYERILNGEDYTELARVESDDIGSRENGGDLGFNEQGTFDPEFEAVAYDLGVNQVSAPVKTEFGYHIIKVLDIEEAVTPSLADVREEVERAYRLAASEDDFVETSSRLAELLFESADLDVPAAELGLEIRETGPLTRD
ncbi:MAG: peptidylprolyl isomerase, partial [Proteobacteria bacterium]|nr:peptidylprolyl isomerase [Pseudomonadota bacterium]